MRPKYCITEANIDIHRQTHTKCNSWWLKDAKGIEVARVCEECEGFIVSRYDPRVFNPCSYDEVVDEQIEEDY